MKSLFLHHNFILLILMLCSFGAFAQNKDTRIFNDTILQISGIKINSIHSDFGPFVIQDTLYFTTFNDKLIGKTDKTLRNSEFYDLYKTSIDKQGNTIGKRIPVSEFATQFNDGPVSWCPKTGELFITQNYNDQTRRPKANKKEVNKLRIIIAKRVNGKWKNIADFPYNNPEYSVGHPAVTTSGDTLVFSSDRPGGFGETDLYISVRSNGKWGIPVNLGPKINTSGKEEFAFLTDEQFNGQYLIFSSKGRFGNGGFDLYYTVFPSDYTEIGHFDTPVNTKFDDFAMTIPTDGQYGYLTSNRPGVGDDDIYKFTFKRLKKPQPKVQIQLPPQEKCRILYVFDQTSLHPIPGVRIVSCDKQYYITDGAGKVTCLPCNENNCEVTASTFGYPDKTKLLMECKQTGKGIVSDTIWMDIKVNTKIALRNIYYDFDKWDILAESAKELDQLVSLMKENPGMKVELGSHTDDRGTDIYNMKLSQLRAQSAVNYIVSKGIDKSRIKGAGYGKTQLIHKGANGQKCTPEQNRENRRTEIYIPGFLRGEAVKQETGDYSNGRPDAAKDYSSFKEHGTLWENDNKVDNTPKVADTPKTAPPKNEKVTKVTEVPKVEKIPVVKDDNIPGVPEAKFYLILGSFQTEMKASVLVEQLKSDGYPAMVLIESGKIRVGIGFGHLGEAKKTLEVLKDKYVGAWINKKVD
jgi:outer membrane protein OmpA-like peptidoglycan-associated protein